MPAPSRRADTQLRLLGDTIACLSGTSVPVWLSGGWALDFVLGEITRDHDDVDLVIFTSDHQVAEDALRARGYQVLVTPHPDEHRHFLANGERLSLTFVEYNDRGELVTPGRWADWPYAPGALDGPPVAFAGIQCRTLSVAAQLETKLNFEAHQHGAPRRHKDLLDIARLRDLVPPDGNTG